LFRFHPDDDIVLRGILKADPQGRMLLSRVEFRSGRNDCVLAGLYRKMQMIDCIVNTTDEYITLTVRLAKDQAFRQSIRARIAAQSAALFDDPAEVRCLENALLCCAGNRR
jgi:hypothetical protein